jgi:polyhydroxyalkanoate synthesis regulator phasin
MTDEERPEESKSREGGFKQGLGILAAMKEAIEETIQEARERGDLDPEKAKEFFRGAMEKAHGAAGEARSRLEEIREKDLPSVQEAMEDLRGRVQKLEDAFRRRGDPGGDEEDASGGEGGGTDPAEEENP